MQMHLTGLAGAHPGWPGAQVNVEKYHEWIQLVAELTVSSLNSWQWASNSVFYLLGLWSRLVSSMPYLKGESPSLLETYVPKITEAYLTSRSAQATQCPRLPPPASLKASHPVTRPLEHTSYMRGSICPTAAAARVQCSTSPWRMQAALHWQHAAVHLASPGMKQA